MTSPAASNPTSKRERFRNLFSGGGTGTGAGTGSTSGSNGNGNAADGTAASTTPAAAASSPKPHYHHSHLHLHHKSHPPRTSQTRPLPGGLSLRSPSLRATPEDKLQDDLPDDVDIEFLSLDSPKYDEPDTYLDEDLGTIDELRLDEEDDDNDIDGEGSGRRADGSDNDEDDMKDWPEEDGSALVADEAVHIEGVPRSEIRLSARQYKQDDFSKSLLTLLRDQLKVPGWAELGPDTQTSQMNIHKVSGSLTNAVFFISYPDPASSNEAAMELGAAPSATSGVHVAPGSPPPTVLLRIYGPSSGNLVSRRKELHVLYTLSASYAIGPAIFGTFANGRVEQYFESRALYKEEMRDPRTSRWIARRMRELHRVDLTLMELPPDPTRDQGTAGARKGSVDFTPNSTPGATPGATPVGIAGFGRPGMPSNDSGSSYLSTSSASSVFSMSSLSSSSGGSTIASPRLTARSSSRPGVSEGAAPRKKRSHSSLGSRSSFSLEGEKWKRPRSIIWQNVDDWSKEAKKVMRKAKKLDELIAKMEADGVTVNSGDAGVPTDSDILLEVNPLVCPTFLKEARKRLDLGRFEKEVKHYRKFIEKWEANNGKSKRVFAHNDAQSGNLLRLTPGGKDEMVPGLRAPHEMIIVVDFEYAGVNPRGLDIANHFLEWQTDYHHPTFSHSLSRHDRGPTIEERQRFYRAYIPCDGGFDVGVEAPMQPLSSDDSRVQRLEDEVRLWTAASHAMYTVWSIVQATDDIAHRIEGWLADPKSAQEGEALGARFLKRDAESLHSRDSTATKSNGRPRVHRGKSGDEIVEYPADGETAHAEEAAHAGEATEAGEELEVPIIGDFDYMGYALERVRMFREELQILGVSRK